MRRDTAPPFEVIGRFEISEVFDLARAQIRAYQWWGREKKRQ